MVQLGARYGKWFSCDPYIFLDSEWEDALIRAALLKVVVRDDSRQGPNGTITDDVNDLS